jgi:anti-sigma factor RsiW
MTCKELIDFLDEYVEGGLSAARRRQFERHLAVCEDCVNYLASYKQTMEAGKWAFGPVDGPVPSEVPAGLLKAVLAAME